MESLKPSNFEAESSSSEGTDEYLTPDEYAEDENVLQTRMTDDQMRGALSEADAVKTEGTDFFRAGRWGEALDAYCRGLGRLPRRRDIPKSAKGKGKARDDTDVPEREESKGDEGDAMDDSLPPLSELELECAKARSILNGNIGACYVKLNEHKKAVEACSDALLDDPQYVKVLHRRATSNEVLATWSSLTAAEEDYNSLINLLPASSPLLPEARLALRRVKPRREEAQKRETDEMMDKLKGLGNSILGNFGLSTDNFKFEPNGQGGYSVNFVK